MEPPEHHLRRQQPSIWFVKLLSLQSDILSQCLLSLTSPFLSLLSLPSTFQETAAAAAPSTVGHGGAVLVRKAMVGFLGAVYVCLVLTAVMVVSGVVGVGLVNMWVEEPVYLREKLHFDYTDVHPYAVFDFGHGGGGAGEFEKVWKMGVPVGQTLYVRLVFVMPESDYNRDVGMFQVIAKLISTDGNVIATSSHPCMLRFRSLPIRLMQTFLMGVPLLLGFTSETQTINVPLLKHKEQHHPRTQSVIVSLVPRAGTPFLPQIYEAEIVLNSELPWSKALVRSWKWTFYVWTSLYIYLMLLIVLVCGFRSIMFPAMTSILSGVDRVILDAENDEEPQMISAREIDTSETIRRWKESRSKRKAMLLGGRATHDAIGSDASSVSVTRDDISVTTEEFGDSESVCH